MATLQHKLRRWFAGTLPGTWEEAAVFLRDSLKKLELALFEVLEEAESSASRIGRDGGQTIAGGRRSGNLTLTSRDTTPKGNIYFGSAQTSTYDELNARWGFGTGAPGALVHAQVNSASESVVVIVENQGAGGLQVRLTRGAQTWAQRIDGSNNYTIRDVTGAKSPLSIATTAPDNAVRVDASGNLGVNTATFGTSAAKVMAMILGTAATTSPADTVQWWVGDAAAGDANLFFLNEGAKRTRVTGIDARLAAQFDKTDTSLANVTGLTFNVEAGKSYSLLATGTFDATAAGGHKYAIAGTCTATSIEYHVRSITDATGAWTASRHTALASATAFAVGPLAGATVITGTITVNAAGTLTVQFAQQVASGTSSLRRGWTFHIREIT